jgi:uncharacterized protein
MISVIIICNATPLINFAAINRLDIVQATFDSITIPQAVYEETIIPGFPGSEPIARAVASGWLQVREVLAVSKNIPTELDNGEREAIALAIEMNAQQILLDEKEARQVSQNLGLRVMGTLGILLLAKQTQKIPQVQPLLNDMIDIAQYWVKDSLYQEVLRQAGEAEFPSS